MWKYVSVAEMVAIEREADASGWTYAKMMEWAGKGLAEVVHQIYYPSGERTVLGLIGSGNNGGDTLVALSLLAQWGWHASAYLVRPRPEDDPLVARLKQAGGRCYQAVDDPDYRVFKAQLAAHRVILDGVLGTGVRLPLKKEVAEVLALARQTLANLKDTHVVAVDCPSGVDCDSGQAAPECIPAELTVTMAAAKRGLFQFPAYNLVGDLRFVGIGLGVEAPYPAAWHAITRFVPDKDWVCQVLPPRPLDAHKGTFGTALVVAGSLNYTGAALLAGEAAYRSGAGLVTLAIPEPLHAPLAGRFPEATWILLPEDEGVISEHAARVIWENLGRATALLIGPGFGLKATTGKFISSLLKGKQVARPGMGLIPSAESGNQGEEAPLLPPLVIDADALKLLAQIPGWFRQIPGSAVLTPHPGEMSVLSGLSTKEIQANRLEIAERYAREWGHVVVLKGAFTVVAAPDGQTAIIPVASPALARAGSGDVLAGLIVGLRAQGVEPFPAAVAGAWIHAQAGLRAAKSLGSTASVLAGDILRGVLDVMRELV